MRRLYLFAEPGTIGGQTIDLADDDEIEFGPHWVTITSPNPPPMWNGEPGPRVRRYAAERVNQYSEFA